MGYDDAFQDCIFVLRAEKLRRDVAFGLRNSHARHSSQKQAHCWPCVVETCVGGGAWLVDFQEPLSLCKTDLAVLSQVTRVDAGIVLIRTWRQLSIACTERRV